MRRVFVAIAMLAAVLCGPARAADNEVIPLYQGVAPGSESWTWSETSTVSPEGSNFRNVVKPTITVHKAAKPNGTAMLVLPGGGFRSLAYGKEGDTIAHWLNEQGITAFVLKYRLAYTEPGVDVPPLERIEAAIPLGIADAKQAMRIIKQRSGQYGVTRTGVMGFSAGGLIVLALGTEFDAQTRPDFVAAIYPAVPRGMTVPANAPPLFVAYAMDDPHVPLDGMEALKAWQAAKVPAELHLYAKGGHGFALRKQGLPVNTWDARFVDWLKWSGFLPN